MFCVLRLLHANDRAFRSVLGQSYSVPSKRPAAGLHRGGGGMSERLSVHLLEQRAQLLLLHFDGPIRDAERAERAERASHPLRK